VAHLRRPVIPSLYNSQERTVDLDRDRALGEGENIRMRRRAIASVVLLFSVPMLFAKDNKDRERTYDVPFDKVWTACVRTANEKYTITFSNKADGVISFEEGMSWRTNSWGMRVGVTVVAITDTQTKVMINPQKKQSQASWAGRDITKKFFAAVDQAVKQ
jgi:hypothetical protein